MDVDAGRILEFFRLGGLLTALIVFLIAWLIGRVLRDATAKLATTFVARRLLIEQTSAFLRFAVYVCAAILGVRLMFTFSSEMMTVVGGTVVVTVGLLLKDQASSFLGGIILLIEKPFQVGDRVTFGGYYGEIKSVGLRSVRLVTLDDNEVTIPNSKFLMEPVASGNSGELTMLVQQDFFVGVDQDITRAKEIVEEALTSSCYFYADAPWTVLVNQVQLDMMIAVRLRSKGYVLEIRYEKAFESDVSQRVLEVFSREGILPPAVLHRSTLPPVEATR